MISNSGSKYEHIFKIGRLLCAMDFDFTLEGLEHEMEVRQQILRLQDCRNNGLRLHLAAAFYTKLKAQRESEMVEKPRETILDYIRSARTKIRHMQANPLMTMTTRRSAGPLDIVGLPCYEKLSEDERDCLSTSGFYYSSFQNFNTPIHGEYLLRQGLFKNPNGSYIKEGRQFVGKFYHDFGILCNCCMVFIDMYHYHKASLSNLLFSSKAERKCMQLG